MTLTVSGHSFSQPDELRALIEHALAHLDHVLPAQAPIQDFVHHNTLHGFQHLPFTEALAEAEKLTGIQAYLPEEEFRRLFQQGRIDEDDLAQALAHSLNLARSQDSLALGGESIQKKELYRLALLFDFEAITASELNWLMEELNAAEKVQSDVPETIKQLYTASSEESAPVRKLWETICARLELTAEALHPEQLLDLNLGRTESWLSSHEDTSADHAHTRKLGLESLRAFIAEIGTGMTLREAVHSLSGTDVLDSVRPQLITLCASALDEGVAAWQLPDRSESGLYAGWRKIVRYDLFPFLHELADFSHIVADLPEDAVECIQLQLAHFGLPANCWEPYLTRLALEMPGWAGMINWRQQNSKYVTPNNPRLQLADFLAIRLVMDRLYLNQVCREIWRVDAHISALQSYFEKNLSEFIVRRQLYSAQLPEYLTREAEALVIRAGSERQCRQQWRHLADLVLIWRESALGDEYVITANNAAWRLFRLAQHLGLTAEEVNRSERSELLKLLAEMDHFPVQKRREVWLYAYERHYQKALFQALQANRERGRWRVRNSRPVSQVIFCMDDREESFRRHLEELEPRIETLGAAGFFGVAMNYRGLDDNKAAALCPIVVTPAHEVRERARTGAEQILQQHQSGRTFNLWLASVIHHGLRAHPLTAYFTIIAGAPFALAGLLAKGFTPAIQHGLMSWIKTATVAEVPTELFFHAEDGDNTATPANPRLGFTDQEQADRVAAFLKNTGLTYGFAPLVVLMGHGSISQNNPHLAAYDCGACSGRHGGPNARLFAAMANRPEVRAILAEKGIIIPGDCWFIGAEHNTCNEEIEWFDETDLPADKKQELQTLRDKLAAAQQLSAHERCRRLASAPREPELEEALAHIRERAADFSQARPELGHATNAAAVVGRRSVTQGAFLDRRVFLISYDCTQDPDGKILEGILLAVGPVGAGINLEYYFSTVNNERFGCGTKVPHNIVGLFAVMEGTSSDLRTGLPRQMIEIHEAMRLQLVVEAKPAILGEIYSRQESLRELIAGNWLYLSVIDPDDGSIHVFESGEGFIRWGGENREVPEFTDSPACYHGQTAPVAPALIAQPQAA